MRTTTFLSMTLTALTLMVLALLLTGCAPKAPACDSGMVKIGSVCCVDADTNGQCDKAAGSAPTTTPGAGSTGTTGTTGTSGAGSTAGASGTSTGASAGTASGASALKARGLVDIQDALERYLNYYVTFKKDEVPANHYEDADNDLFTVYGSTNIDLLVVKDEKDWFTDYAGFEALMQRYAENRKEFNRARLDKTMKSNYTFTHWMTLKPLEMPGATILEYRDSAEIDLHGTNDMGAPYVDSVQPFGVVTILVPCKPNVVVAFSSTSQPNKFVANYEGEEYRSELEKSLNDLSTELQYKARKILSTCKMD